MKRCSPGRSANPAERALILHEPSEEPIARTLCAAFLDQELDAHLIRFTDRANNQLAAPCASIVAVLPRHPGGEGDEVGRLRLSMARFFALFTLLRQTRASLVAFVQFGGGSFGNGPEPAAPEQCCAAAIARTLHLEQPELRVRVIDLANSLPPEQIARIVCKTLGGAEGFTAVGVDACGTCRVPRAHLQQPAQYQPRAIQWTDRDVILITGGGKGITAECALALGQATRARLALVGSSPLPTEAGSTPDELTRNLARFEAEQLSYRYYPCDLTCSEAVHDLLERVRHEQGAITGVVHGAAVNRPARLLTSRPEEAFAEIAPKVLGAYHLGQALAHAPPKLFVGLTSIIGITGMAGNGWYAFSNELLDLWLRQFRARHGCHVLSVAFNIWGQTGMGVRLSRVAQLQERGIESIPSAEGARRFVQLFTQDPGHRQVVVTARLGSLDTWPAPQLSVPGGLRFLDRLIVGCPGVELVVRTRLQLERDRYLEDHCFNGSYLFPTVFGLEAMAQAALVLSGDDGAEVQRIQDLRLDRPIIVDPSNGTEIEIRALARETPAQDERTIEVVLRSEETGFRVDHFAATLVLGPLQAGPSVDVPPVREPLPIDPVAELYGNLLFQGPRFQRMERVLELDSDHVVLEASVNPSIGQEQSAGASEDGGRFLLGDPFLRDVLLQAGQLTIPHHICLPIRIERIERYAPPSGPVSSCLVFAPRKVRHGNEYVAEVFATDAQGRVLEKLTGYGLRVVGERRAPPSIARDIPGPPIESAINPAWHCVRVAHDGPQGQPVQEMRFQASFQEASSVSRRVPASRFQFWMGRLRELVTSGPLPQLVDQIATGEWGLVTNWAEVQMAGEVTANDVIHARFWTHPAHRAAVEFCCDFWKWLPDDNYERVATVRQKATWVRIVGPGLVEPADLPDYLARYLEQMGPRTSQASPPVPWPEPLAHLRHSAWSSSTRQADGKKCVLARDTIQTTLAEANLVGNVYFAHSFTWQERVRDLFLHATAPESFSALAAPDEPLCLSSRVDYLREAMPFDRIEVAMSARCVEECRAILDFDIFKVLPDNQRHKLAAGWQEVVWVERNPQGKPVEALFPAPVRDALRAGPRGKDRDSRRSRRWSAVQAED